MNKKRRYFSYIFGYVISSDYAILGHEPREERSGRVESQGFLDDRFDKMIGQYVLPIRVLYPLVQCFLNSRVLGEQEQRPQRRECCLLTYDKKGGSVRLLRHFLFRE